MSYLFIYYLLISESHSPFSKKWEDGLYVPGYCLRETKRHHSKHSTPFHAPLHSMLYKLHTSMIRRHPLLIKEKPAVGRICKFRLPMGENSFKYDLL